MGGIFDKLKIIPIRLAILLKKEKPLYRKICLMRGPPVLVPNIKKVYLKSGLKTEKKSPIFKAKIGFMNKESMSEVVKAYNDSKIIAICEEITS